MVLPSPSPTVTTLNRSGRIAFFAIDNRILYSSDSDSVGGFPVLPYKVAQGVFRLKTPKENLSLVVWGLVGMEKKLQIRFNSVRRIRRLADVRRPIYICHAENRLCIIILCHSNYSILYNVEFPLHF